MYGGYNAQNTGGSAPQPPTYNYDNLFGTADNTNYNAQQYQQYLNALSQYSQQPSTNNPASVAAGYGSMLDSYAGAYPANSTNVGATAEPTAQFNSFEQAMMQQAQLQGVNRQNIGGFVKKPFGQKNFIGKGFQQGGFQQGFPKRKGPPKAPIDPSKYYCDVCNIACANPQAFQDHNAGKAHNRKVELSKGNAQPLAKNKSSFKCEVCKITCTGKESFETHINGVKHGKALKNLQRLGKTVPENVSTIIPPSNPFMRTDVNSNNGSAVIEEEESLPPIGEEFIEAIQGSGKQTQFKCKLCDCICGDATAKNLHIRGRRHRLAYKQKVDFSIHVDAKPNARNNIKARKQFREKEQKITVFPANWIVVQPNVVPAIPDTGNYDAYDEQHICAKLEQLRADPKFIEETDSLIGMVEKSLKKTSDALTEKLRPPTEANSQENDEDNRILRGVIRIGVLGDRLLTKTDRQIHAALLCKEIPTVSLLQSITSIFIENIENEEIRKKTILETSIEDSGFSVKFNDGEITCFITMTSFALANLDNKEAGDATNVKIEKPKDALPLERMQNTLSQMRQTKFFQSQCWPIQGLCETVVLLRDLFSRIPLWNVLSLHTIELLAYKTMISSPVMLRVSDAFRRFFEMVSSGQFMSPRTKLIDPCERNEFDLFATISKQQRENMLCSAQDTIRLIAFDQIHQVLGIERLPVSNRKRPNNEEDDEENGSNKKEKKEGSDEKEGN